MSVIVRLKEGLESVKYFITKFSKGILAFARLVFFSRNAYRKIGKNMSGRSAVIVGNGPSLRKQVQENLTFFQNRDVICVNGFPMTEEYKVLKPVACVWIDPSYFDPKTKAELKPHAVDGIKAIVENTTWEIYWYLPHFAKGREYYKGISELNPLIKIVFFNYTIFDTFDFINHFMYRTRWAMPRATTVVVAALHIAITRKYDRTFVAGVETDFIKNIIVDKNNVLYFEQKHFYTKERVFTKIEPLKAFGKLNLGNYLSHIANIYKGYTALDVYAKYMNVPVINVTPDSYIDAFEKKDISEL